MDRAYYGLCTIPGYFGEGAFEIVRIECDGVGVVGQQDP